VSEARRLRILLVDDHDVVHWGFRLLLTRQSWVERCLTASTGKEAKELTRHYSPHVALVDLLLAGESGADVCEALRAELPSLRVLMISGAGRISAQTARAAGASGFVTKDWDADDIVKAIRMVGMGMTVFDRERERPASPLSDRERGVLQLIATGATNREIAEQLYLSPHTVKEHTSAVYRKLSVRNRTEAVKHAERLGLIT